MPEGDTIRRLADRLGPRLVDTELVQLVIRGVPRDPAGRRVTGVRAVGKHLVIALDDGTEIRTHLGMNGGWYRFDPGSPVTTGGDRTSVVIGTAQDVFACRRAATVEITGRRAPGRGAAIARLGQDLLGPTVDFDAVMDRVADQPATRAIGGVLMDQRIAAGIGNIWRCESLFRVGVDPRTPVGDVDPDRIRRAYELARELMTASVADHRAESFVHDRGGQRCRVCGATVASYLLEERWTYSCPSCQPPA
jgi:endonuclease VIII